MRPPTATLLAFALAFAAAPAASAQAPDASQRPGARLREVVAVYWNDLLKRHPIEATIYVGDHRFDDRLNDPSVAAYNAWLGNLRATRAALDAIDPAGLSTSERLDRAVLLGMIDDRLALERFGDHLIPVVQIARASTDVRADDLHLVFSQLGELHPAATGGDVENFLRRLHEFPKLALGLEGVLRQGMAERRMPPRVVMTRALAQLRALGTGSPEEHPLWAFTHRLPDDWPEPRRIAAVQKVRDAIAHDVQRAYARLADFVAKDYLPACRDSVGLCDTPDGRAHYAALVRHYTTTDQAPDQIHATGLAAMAKARAGMEEVRRKVGFAGDLKAFLKHVRDDPALRNRDAQSILDGHRAIVAAVETSLPRLFGRLPLTPVEVRPFDPVRARSAPTGEYLPPPSDGSRPGVFFVNTSDPSSRPTYTMQALAYHEALPGHHLQMALSLEAPGRPAFRRYFYLPAFDEGWALYAEGLPAEVGLYTDPYAELGRLNYDAHRCARLVVDTGIHAQGWTRDRAIAYMEENTSLPRVEIENEVDRYIAWPGQALAYKVGDLAIRAARAQAEARDGKSFDLRAFHDRLLASGSVPLRLIDEILAGPTP
jgi:prolyl oligopeptidase